MRDTVERYYFDADSMLLPDDQAQKLSDDQISKLGCIELKVVFVKSTGKTWKPRPLVKNEAVVVSEKMLKGRSLAHAVE